MVGLGRCQEVLYFDLSKEIIHVPTLQGFIVWIHHPPESTSLHSCFPLKRLAFESSLPLEISSNPWGVGMKIFWNHTIVEDVFLLFLDMSTMEDAGKISNRCMWKKKTWFESNSVFAHPSSWITTYVVIVLATTCNNKILQRYILLSFKGVETTKA